MDQIGEVIAPIYKVYWCWLQELGLAICSTPDICFVLHFPLTVNNLWSMAAPPSVFLYNNINVYEPPPALRLQFKPELV